VIFCIRNSSKHCLKQYIFHKDQHFMNHNRKISRQLFQLLTAAAVITTASAFAENTVTTAIEGVIAQGTQLEFIKDKFEGTEGPVALPDGGVVFTETRANRITRINDDGSTSSFLENTNGSNGLGFNKKGELISVQVNDTKVGIIYPAGKEKVLTDNYNGVKYQRPNDLVVNKSGNIYFTDSGVAPNEPNGEPARPAVYFLTADGKVNQLLKDIERPNGIQLSRDEKTLYVANTGGEYVLAYPVLGESKLGPRKEFAKLSKFEKGENGSFSSGADGLAIDDKGRLYVASNAGVEIFDEKGAALGVIPVPQKPQNIAFAGKDKKTLFIVGRGAAYKIPVLTPGFKGRAK
jgi:gluconolactonase